MTTLDTSQIIDLVRPIGNPHGRIKIAIDNRTGLFVHVRSLDPRKRNGLACDCRCIGCGGAMVAKQGDIEWHFAHYVITDCPASRESTLHLAAKSIFQETRRIGLPGYRVGHRDWQMAGPNMVISNIRYQIGPRRAVLFDRVELEQSYVAGTATEDDRRRRTPFHVYRIVPDAVAHDGKSFMFVEFVVTHEIEVEKKEYVLHALGIPTIEVRFDHLFRKKKRDEDESQVTSTKPTLDELENDPALLDIVRDLLASWDHRYWVVPPVSETHRSFVEGWLHQKNRESVKQQVLAWRAANR